ncbi:hypothetical protein FRC12_017243, partial [Ceratobasidium sp. 428]
MASSPNDMKPLPSAFGSVESHYWGGETVTPAKPLVELEMTRLSAALRLKPFWYTKFRDQDILAKWRAEALEQAEHMKESHVDYDTGAEVGCYDRIWQSDKLVTTALKAKIVEGVAKLEDVPDSEKDWHPRSNNVVLDLVHPSLYPIVYGRTLAYPARIDNRDVAKLNIIQSPPSPGSQSWAKERSYHVSRKFQWLPTDFVVSDDGKSVKSTGYINNLHPDQHAGLHAAIEKLIGAYIPLFERVLTDSIPSNKAVPARTKNTYSYDEGYKPEPEWKDDMNDDEEEEYERLHKEWFENRPIVLPDVPSEGYVLGSLEKRSAWYSLAGKTIQVIVKLANIHLTPEKSEAIAFPNVYQHKVSPFGLKDKSKPGHRKIVALFLVDPAIQRPSTTRVPPQQQEWRAAAISSNKVLRSAFNKLAPEIIDRVNSFAEGTMTLEEAKSYRLELMEERKAFVKENDEKFFQVAFDM